LIKGFRSKRLRALFEKDISKGVQPKHVAKLGDILGMLNTAVGLGDLKNASGLYLKKLTPRSANRWEVRVDENFRVTFVWLDGDVDDVDYEDTH